MSGTILDRVSPIASPNRSVAARVTLSDPARTPRIILAVGPCRSGSTPLVMALAAAGVEAHMQPMKIILRCLAVGVESEWRLPTPPPETLFVKETLGPYFAAEVEFDPLEILLEVGVPASSIDLLIVGRDPLSTWSSWSEWWGERTSIEMLAASMQAAERIRDKAIGAGIHPTTFVYEALRDSDPIEVGRRLFSALDLPYEPTAVTDWAGTPALGEPGSPIHWPPMPARFAVPHIHDRVRQTSSLTYFDRDAEIAALPADEVARIQQAGLGELYALWHRRCAETLRLPLTEVPAAP